MKDNMFWFGEMYEALKLAEGALNTAPRFKIPSHEPEYDDSYKVAARVTAVLRAIDK